ncbi:uncharacterized protein EV422DRAFT_396866 [Fimicolochytrium jonesii]|uniref:uncharacterized protein n=1 Tax=Fimicolochytrium jonesii TaxID=1396493 RepID=UPI0022FDF7F0|nr:uncharacterized protein EV422DRAFT_396866 [Fimicolochytrium jonesii]KAI8822393.1 hypothetical protein EV422DRAFT_396866 [Fimicolochytrium jonesii]
MFAAVRNRDVSTLRSLLLLADPSTTGGSPHHYTLGPGSGSFGKQSGFKGKGGADVNKRDTDGNTALHVATSLGNYEVVETLLESAKVNVNLQDVESGYTPLHRALYDGNIWMALLLLQTRSDCDLMLTDREGNTCLDLLASTMEITRPKSELIQSDSSDEDEEDVPSRHERTADAVTPSTSLWTWGANTNYVLGQANSDDRAFPERVGITTTYKRKRPNVTALTFDTHDPLTHSLTLSKYHGGVLTSSGLFMHGFGAGGRLGLGNEETTLLPTLVCGIKGEISLLTLGPEHSVAVTTIGEVWTWGSNKLGQLGYLTELNGTEPSCELEPREVGGVIKKIRIIGAAASRHHTAVFSDTGAIFTWGLSVGQLGYNQPLNTVHAHPKKITDFPQQDLLQISATKNATAVLTATYEVFVFAEFRYQRVAFGLQLSAKGISIHQFRNEKPPYVKKIVSGNHQFAALTTSGDVFLWSPPEPEFADTWQQQSFPQKRPRKVWSVRKKHFAARDVAIGIDSTLIIRTDSGHVFIGTRRKNLKVKAAINDDAKEAVYYKYHRIPGLQHVEQVAASVSGAFAAIRVDRRPPIIAVPTSTLREDLRDALAKADNEEEFPNPDVVFICRDGVRKRAHRVILGCRSPFFLHLFREMALSRDSPVRVVQGLTARRITSEDMNGALCDVYEISCPDLHSKSVSLALDYIYTGGFQRDWDHSIFLKSGSKSKRRGSVTAGSKGKNKAHHYDKPSDDAEITPAILHREFNALIKMWDLGDSPTSYIAPIDGPQYFEHIYSIYTHLHDKFAPFTDITLRASDGSIHAHSVILAARCAFFKAMVNGQWAAVHEDNKRVVSLSHFRVEVLQVALDYIYGRAADKVFVGIEKPGVAAFITFVMEVLACADELMLDGLKRGCEVIILRDLSVTTMVRYLKVADMYGCAELKDRCLDFVCWNLGTAIESRLLSDIEEDLLDDIQSRLHELQRRKFPFMRGPDSPYLRAKSVALQEEEDRKNRRREEYERRMEVAAKEEQGGSSGESDVPERKGRYDSSGAEGDGPEDGDEDVFDMELEGAADASSSARKGRVSNPALNAKPQTPTKKGKKTWKKVDLNGLHAVGGGFASPTPAGGLGGSPQSQNKGSPFFAPGDSGKPRTAGTPFGVGAGDKRSSVKSWAPVATPRTAEKVSLKDIIMKEAGSSKGTPTVNGPVGSRSAGTNSTFGERKGGESGPFSARRVSAISTALTPGAAASTTHLAVNNNPPLNRASQLPPRSPLFPATSSSQDGPPALSLSVSLAGLSISQMPSPTKMSQKERRRSAAAARASGSNNHPGTPPPPPQLSAWATPQSAGSPSKHPPPPISRGGSSSAPRIQHHPLTPTAGPSPSPNKPACTQPTKPETPLSLREIMQHEASTSAANQSRLSSFASIQAEQLQAAQALTRKLKKPLERIQAEERAIVQLKEFYDMTRVEGSTEWVVVVREGESVAGRQGR